MTDALEIINFSEPIPPICNLSLIEKGFLPPKVKTGNLDSVRTIADVRDAVRAYFILVNSDHIPNGAVFNIGGSFTCKVGDILE